MSCCCCCSDDNHPERLMRAVSMCLWTDALAIDLHLGDDALIGVDDSDDDDDEVDDYDADD